MPYQLIYYKSFEETISLCKNAKYYGFAPSFANRQKYFDDYLKKLDAKSVIIEHDYIDRNFTDDYCGYYSRCFQDYPKKCERLHFFSIHIEEASLDRAIVADKTDKTRKQILDNYLGYIVLRPVTGAPLGRVCLSTYPPENGKNRSFPVLKTYHAHFLGFDFKVETVAFQEQDNVISACATSALWSAFHAISGNPIHRVPSPFTITEHAKRIFPDTISNVMDKGLYPSQMAAAITEEGYNPILCGYISKSYLKALSRAYLNVGIPLILGMSLSWENESIHNDRNILGNYSIGEHAVTIMGYRSSMDFPKFSHDSVRSDVQIGALHLLSSSIDKFYVHDDQVGPFASMPDRNEYWQRLETRWNFYIDPSDKVVASVNSIIIPCHKKIRIRFQNVYNLISRCNSLWSNFWSGIGMKLIWDVRLFCVNEFKQSIVEKTLYPNTNNDLKSKIIKTPMPLYLWVVDSFILDEQSRLLPAFSYILDATDMEGSDYLICGVHHDKDIFEICCSRVRDLKTQNKLDSLYANNMNHVVLKKLLENYWNYDHPKIWV